MVKSYSKILNEGFNKYFERLNESNDIYTEWNNMTKEPAIGFPNGEYFYIEIDPLTGTMYAGSASNTGIFREFEIDLDEDDSLDGNLNRLYDTIIEERPELLDGELDESYTDSDLMNAVQDAYGFNKKEAKEWIKNASDESKEEIVRGFKDNAKRSFLTDSLKEGKKRLSERDWQLQVPSVYREEIEEAADAGDIEGVRYAIMDICDYVIGESTDDLIIDEYTSLKDELEYCDMDTLEDADFWLNDLYDLMDNTGVFLGING